jgi:two-component system sensor kinase FixL
MPQPADDDPPREPSPTGDALGPQMSVAAEASLMRAIIATATEGIVTMDERGRIHLVNRAAELMFGYAPGALVGRSVTDLMPEPYRSEHSGYVHSYLTTGVAKIIGIGREVTALRRDGSQFPLDLSVGEGSHDGRRFFVAILRDVSERRDLQAKLSLAERLAALGELAAGVAHEINNPVTTILNCAQLIQDGDDAREHAAMIADEGARIASIVQDLLQFARSDRKDNAPTDLQDALMRTARLVREGLQRHGITLELSVADGLPHVAADRSQLQQVMLNLIHNARDALLPLSDRPRRILVEAHPDRGGVALVVRDTGPGVPLELRTRIFEPFFTTKRTRGGTGLGLSITKSLIDGFGGSVTVAGAPGQGAEFCVWLPAANPA